MKKIKIYGLLLVISIGLTFALNSKQIIDDFSEPKKEEIKTTNVTVTSEGEYMAYINDPEVNICTVPVEPGQPSEWITYDPSEDQYYHHRLKNVGAPSKVPISRDQMKSYCRGIYGAGGDSETTIKVEKVFDYDEGGVICHAANNSWVLTQDESGNLTYTTYYPLRTTTYSAVTHTAEQLEGIIQRICARGIYPEDGGDSEITISVEINEGPSETLCNNPKIVNRSGTYYIDGRRIISDATTANERPTEVQMALARCQDPPN